MAKKQNLVGKLRHIKKVNSTEEQARAVVQRATRTNELLKQIDAAYDKLRRLWPQDELLKLVSQQPDSGFGHRLLWELYAVSIGSDGENAGKPTTPTPKGTKQLVIPWTTEEELRRNGFDGDEIAEITKRYGREAVRS
jgi:hypothetical protein